MTELLRIFDPYSRQARLYPALLTLLPLLVAVLVWFPSLLTMGHLVLTIIAACGVLYLLSDIARSRGKRVEPSLLAEWGGWPTTIWLRHRDNHLSGETRRRYHQFFARQPLLGVMPSEAEENVDQRAADEKYASAAEWLKEQCRGASFPLVEKEVAAYGFRRNLLGLKPFGIVLSLASIAFPALWTLVSTRSLYESTRVYGNLQPGALGSVAFGLIALVAWIFVVKRTWVREGGDQYARALLSNCDTLHVSQP